MKRARGKGAPPAPDLTRLAGVDVRVLDLPEPTARVLFRHGIRTLLDLVSVSDAELKLLRGIGDTRYALLKDLRAKALQRAGLVPDAPAAPAQVPATADDPEPTPPAKGSGRSRQRGRPPKPTPQRSPKRPPKNLAAAVAAVLATGDEDGAILRRRFVDGHTLARVGRARGVTLERARQRIAQAIERARLRHEDALSALLAPILAEAEAQGGILDTRALDGVTQGELSLALVVANHSDWRPWGEGFLVERRVDGLHRRLESWRRRLNAFGAVVVPWPEVERLAKAAGLHLSRDAYARLCETEFGLVTQQDGVVVATTPGSRLVALLHEAAGPMRIEALVTRYVERFESSSGKATLGTRKKRDATAHRFEAHLSKRPEAWNLEPELWVHEVHLPFDVASAGRLVHAAMRALRRHPRGMAAGALLSQVGGDEVPGLTPSIFAQLLRRHPDVAPSPDGERVVRRRAGGRR